MSKRNEGATRGWETRRRNEAEALRRAKNLKLSEAALRRNRGRTRGGNADEKRGSFYVIAPFNINRTLLTTRVAALAHAQHKLKESGDPPPGGELAVVRVVARVRRRELVKEVIEVVWEE